MHWFCTTLLNCIVILEGHPGSCSLGEFFNKVRRTSSGRQSSCRKHALRTLNPDPQNPKSAAPAPGASRRAGSMRSGP